MELAGGLEARGDLLPAFGRLGEAVGLWREEHEAQLGRDVRDVRVEEAGVVEARQADRLDYESAAAKYRLERARKDAAEEAAAALESQLAAQREAQEGRERIAAAEVRMAAADARAAEAARRSQEAAACVSWSDYGDETPAQTRARLERDANLVWGANWRDR